MKKLFSLLFVSVFFVACQKEADEVAEQPLPEQTTNNVSYGTDAAQRMDVYLPAGRTTEATKVMVMIHGGGWIGGDKSEMSVYVPTIKQQLPDYAVFNLNYRLGTFPPPANPFPTQENDVKAAIEFIMGKAEEYKFNKEKIVLLGASAGAHLALLQGYKYNSPKAKAVVSLFGPTDMSALHDYYAINPPLQTAIQLLMSGTPTSNNPLYQSSSPINFVSAQTPPTLLLHGTADAVVPYEQSTALKTKLETAGVSVKLVTYNNAGHGDWSDATFANAFTEIVNFAKAKNP
ncbi:MAG TPA: alpha/beta hydrolase [Flavisolibacter sp.]|nr:alpha/beta hydrolase [Flavisolibacter sp.]